jgi:hypothetical protein
MPALRSRQRGSEKCDASWEGAGAGILLLVRFLGQHNIGPGLRHLLRAAAAAASVRV